MAEFEEKLGAILNNPQAMGQIMALAQSLGGDNPSPPPPAEAQDAVFEPVTFETPDTPSEASSADGLDLDPRLLAMGMKAISAYQDPNNDKAKLLQALRPFVKETRYRKVDKAVQIARISKAIRAVLDSFKGGEEGV